MTDVLFPQMSKENPDAEGVVATWCVADGGQVTAGQLIAEVQVDKGLGGPAGTDRGHDPPAGPPRRRRRRRAPHSRESTEPDQYA